MRQLAGKTDPRDSGFFAKHFPKAHAYFDNKKRFGVLLEAIEKGHKIGQRGLSATHSLLDFEDTQNPRRGQIASIINDALEKCKQQPDLHEFMVKEAQKLEQKGTHAGYFIAGLLYSASSKFSTNPLETSDKFAKACELYTKAACYDDAIITGFYAIPYIRNSDDSVPADRDARLEKLASLIYDAVRLKKTEYACLELPINLHMEWVTLFSFLRAMDPRFGDLRDAAIGSLERKLSQLG